MKHLLFQSKLYKITVISTNSLIMNITLNSEEIKKLIPHRYPFLLIDKVIDLQVDESILAVKNLTANEEFFQGHFPNHPVEPGVLTVEMCAQASGVLCGYSYLYNKHENVEINERLNFSESHSALTDNFVFYLTTIEKTKFRNVMTPGDQLFIYVKVSQKSRLMWKFSAEILINNDPEKKGMEVEFSALIKSI